ncbi:hypothetical protein LP420_19370 [Massilia sp. B-10]|nr:hypothetical protein LP420_19370 [Massilia sp. B-10]
MPKTSPVRQSWPTRQPGHHASSKAPRSCTITRSRASRARLSMMPPKGGSTASDDEIKAAVDYMVGAAK